MPTAQTASNYPTYPTSTPYSSAPYSSTPYPVTPYNQSPPPAVGGSAPLYQPTAPSQSTPSAAPAYGGGYAPPAQAPPYGAPPTAAPYSSAPQTYGAPVGNGMYPEAVPGTSYTR